MEYSNPELPEGINASQEHPIKEFFWLTASVLAAGAMLILVLMLLAETLADQIPFQVEREFTSQYFTPPPAASELDEYLNQLATRIAKAQQLPEEMAIRVHYLDTEVVNAFATLGGNVFIFRGLLEKLPNENSLTLVLAHEIGHIKHRDPIRGMGRAVVIGLSLSMVNGSAGDAILGPALSQGANLTLLKYSRDQERAADDEALAATAAIYGHLEGAAALFDVLESENGPGLTPEFFSTHPLSADRIAKIGKMSQSAADPTITPLPANFDAWLTQSGGHETIPALPEPAP